MSPQERSLIVQLFERLRGAATAPRDPEAEAFIRAQIAQQPYASYAMAQTIVMQTEALQHAQQRIRELEAGVQEPTYFGREAETGLGSSGYGGGIRREDLEAPMGAPGLGRDVGRTSGPWNIDRRASAQTPSAPSPWGQGQPAAQPGGGFLAGAMQTALGVAGGAMLFEGMRGMFGGLNGKDEPSANVAREDAPQAEERLASADQEIDAGENDAGGGWLSDIFGGDGDGGDADSDWG